MRAAFVQRMVDMGITTQVKIACYETNEDILGLLNANLKWIERNASIKIDYEVISENYITSQDLEYNLKLFANQNTKKCDFVISNPPYMKRCSLTFYPIKY